MNSKTALKAIFWIAIVGVLFSGYLTVSELTSGACRVGGGCQQILGLPTCLYGLIMYLTVLIISALGK